MAPPVAAEAASPTRLSYRHASGLHAVSRALDGLHRELLRPEDEEASAVRTSVMNLVAACNDAAAGEQAGDDLLTIGLRHPTRAIVIVADPASEPLLEADISIHCAADSRRVCTELVKLRVQGEPAYHLTSIVTPLLVPDMPVHLWVVGAPPLQQAFSEETVDLTERIIIDSGAYTQPAETLRLIAEQLAHYAEDIALGDVAWERTRVWRESIAQAFEPQAVRPLLHGITEVVVACCGGATLADAWLLAGWLGSRLGWTQNQRPRLRIEEPPSGATSGGAQSMHQVRLTGMAGGHRHEVTVTRTVDCLTTVATRDAHETVSRVVTVPARSSAELIGDMMSEAADDHVYRAAVVEAAAFASMA